MKNLEYENIRDMLKSQDRDHVYFAVNIIRDSVNIDKNILKEVSLFDRIRDYSDVCKELKEREEICPYKKIKQIEKLFCGTWKIDWSNQKQYKYYPYYILNSSGGLVSAGFGYCCSGFSGEVAFYPSREISDFVGKMFIKEYEDLKNN